MAQEAETNQHTYALDPENVSEMTRLIMQDRMMTQGTGGIFPEHRNRLPFDPVRILDLGCGPGGWVLDVAHSYPHCQVFGIDVSKKMIRYAQARALAEGKANVHFVEGNILHPLPYSDAHFDLINMRFAVGFVLRAAWPSVLQELVRVTRLGGIIRLTEVDDMGSILSPDAPHLQTMLTWMSQALRIKGYGFSPDGTSFGMTGMLAALLREAGCHDIQSVLHTLDFSVGSAMHPIQRDNYRVGLLMLKPLYLACELCTEKEFETTYQWAMAEVEQADFRGDWHVLTAWGTKTLAPSAEA